MKTVQVDESNLFSITIREKKATVIPGIYLLMEKTGSKVDSLKESAIDVVADAGVPYIQRSRWSDRVGETKADHRLGVPCYVYNKLDRSLYLITSSYELKKLKKAGITKELLQAINMKNGKMTDILKDMKKNKAMFFKTADDSNTILKYNSKYFIIGCGGGFDSLLEEGIINRSGVVVKTNISIDFVSKYSRSIQQLVDSIVDASIEHIK